MKTITKVITIIMVTVLLLYLIETMFIKLFIVLVGILALIYVVLNTKKSKKSKPIILSDNIPRGICYFDIDDTLTTAIDSPDDIIQACLDNNFAVGISTASKRTINDICEVDGTPKESWMSHKLCKQFRENPNMFNSAYPIIAGMTQNNPNFPRNRQEETQGAMKGFHMKYGKETIYPNIPDKCVVLFDDNTQFINDMKKSQPRMEVACSGKDCGQVRLSKNLVLTKLKQMIDNGC